MPKIKNKPGIHLFKTSRRVNEFGISQWEYYWHIVARNGRIIARSSETYSRKSGAVKSMKAAELIFVETSVYHDHSKEGSPLTIIP